MQILDVISYISTDSLYFNKMIEDFPKIDFNEYKKSDEKTRKIYNYFYNELLKDSKKLNKYIRDPNDLKEKLEKIKNEKIDAFIKQIDKSNILFVISTLLKDENIFIQIKKDNPSIMYDLDSFKNDPNNFKNKIKEYFLDKLNKNHQCLDNYIYNYPNFLEEIRKIKSTSRKEFLNFIGKTFRIKNSEESWMNFSKLTFEKNFKSFSVIEKDDYLEVYFL